MSAYSSSPITLLAACSDAGSDLRNPVTAGPAVEDLLMVLAAVSDPRKSRGVRHRLVTVLAAAVCAVLAGARSYVVIAEWAADLPASVRLRLGIGRGAPSEATFRRVLQLVDDDELDAAVSGWLARRLVGPGGTGPGGTGPGGTGPVRAIAVDGKTARGARVGDGRAVHLLGALDHATGVVLGQTQVDAKTNEITAFAPLLERLDRAHPLAGAVITADALHTQHRHARWLHGRRGTATDKVWASRQLCSSSRTTSPPCTRSSPTCPGRGFRSWSRSAGAGTAGSRPAHCNCAR